MTDNHAKIQAEALERLRLSALKYRERLATIGDNRSTLKCEWKETPTAYEFKCFTGCLKIWRDQSPRGISAVFSMGANSDYSYSTYYPGCTIEEVMILMPFDVQADRR